MRYSPDREPEHAPEGDPCRRCQLPAARHRDRRGREARRSEARRLAELARPIVGIDGEGVDLPCRRCGENDRGLQECPAGPWRCPRHDGKAQGGPGPCARCGLELRPDRCSRPHAYTYLSAVDEDGRKLGSIARADGLRSDEILAFLCDLGEARLFGYSIGYDLAMWVKDLPDDAIYELVRPETRAARTREGRSYRKKVRWQGFEIDYLRRRVDVRRAARDQEGKTGRGPRVTVWDVFGFYQGSFVRSLTDWKTAAKERIDEIAAMKRERSSFAGMPASEVRRYCDDECRLLARLVRQLVEAHEEARLPLRSFYGAGSTASALLDRMGTRELRGPALPPELRHAVACAFFGGRFEASVVGPVARPVLNYDIGSAYPYHASALPCLACGAWRRVTGRETDRRVRDASLAVVRCRVRRSGPSSWGPLPWRASDGSILWPLRLDETWVWRDEYVAARDTVWPGVEAEEAWCYECRCAHAPFALLPETYRERCRIGKEGAGIVLKLGPNSVYGKCAQSVGSAPYQSWVWAGCITSGCRAQVLRAVAAAPDPRSILMVATDGIISDCELYLPAPRDTGTADCRDSKGRPAPLGGWSRDEIPRGVFVARPGIYWPLGGGEVKSVKARGISRSVLGGMTCAGHPDVVVDAPGPCPRPDCGRALERRSTLVERHFAEKGWRHPYLIRGCVRFVGAIAGVRKSGEARKRSDDYGCWIPYPIEVTFGPSGANPKRPVVRDDCTLQPWDRMAGPSAEYTRKRLSAEARLLREQERVLLEQPEGEHEFG